MVTSTKSGGGRSAPVRAKLDIHATATAINIATTGNRFDACPVCESEKTAQLYKEHFHCFHNDCGVHGTAIDLIALHLGLAKPNGDGRFPRLNAEQMTKVRAWLTDHPTPAATPKPKVEPSVLRAKNRREVDVVWDAAGRVDEDAQVPGWLSGQRKLDPKVLADLDLCRALPDEAERFEWCSWWRTGYRLVCPVYGPQGDREGLRARWTLFKKPRKGKSIHPKGWGDGAMTGCVYANPTAVKMLGGEITEPITLIVVEGEPDFLTWASTAPSMAVIGIWAGAWTEAIAERVPDGSTVVLRTDHDEAGDKYAAKVGATLADRMMLLRSRSDKDDPQRDENDRHMAGTLPSDPSEDAEPYDVPIRRGSGGLRLSVNKDGQVKAGRANAITLFEEHADYSGRLWLSDFDGDAYLDAIRIDDGLLNKIMVYLSRTAGAEFRKTPVQEALTFVVGENRRHPLAEWLRSLIWDKNERLQRLLPDYFGTDDDRLHQRLGVMWGVGAVSRPLNPGNKLDHTLILIGEQGTGKSTAVAMLAMRPEWFNDTPADLGTKDARMALRGTWLMELAELDSLKRSEMATIKAFLTVTVDRFRPPYARSDPFYPRSTVFIGTSNEHHVLRDPSGSRRFWPVETTAIDTEGLKRDREQLWAEAVARYQTGTQWWPTVKFEKQLNRHRERFQVSDSWLAPLSEWLEEDAPEEFTTHDALVKGLGLATRDTLRRSAEMRVSTLLRQLGCCRGPRRRGKGDKRLRTWVKSKK